MLNVNKIRKQFPTINFKNIYFDSGATSLKPQCVIDEIVHYYSDVCANVYRGIYEKSQQATETYIECKKKLAAFINAESEREIIFTSSATYSINLVKNILLNSNIINSGDTILTSGLEHHSNLVPWLDLKRKGFNVETILLDHKFLLDINDAERKIKKGVNLLCITHASNVTGEIVPVDIIAKMAAKKGALVLVDASQSILHSNIDVKKMNADIMVFSAHKMLGPTGLGVLYIKESLLKKLKPVFFGGGTIKSVTNSKFELLQYPEAFEPGTPNISAVYGLSKAIDFLNDIGMESIIVYEKQLSEYMIKKFNQYSRIAFYGPKEAAKRIPTFSFTIDNMEPEEISEVLSKSSNIAVRSGMHCAQPVSECISKNGVTRASLAFYNTFKEIDIFFSALNTICEEL